MQNVAVRVRVKRHRTNGRSQIQGFVGDKNISINLHQSPSSSEARVSGFLGQDSVNISFPNSDDGGFRYLRGQIGRQPINGSLERRKPDGDTSFELDHAKLELDRSQNGEYVRVDSHELYGQFTREKQEGDEVGGFQIGRDYLDFSVDRDPHTCLLYTSPSPRDQRGSRMPSSA